MCGWGILRQNHVFLLFWQFASGAITFLHNFMYVLIGWPLNMKIFEKSKCSLSLIWSKNGWKPIWRKTTIVKNIQEFPEVVFYLGMVGKYLAQKHLQIYHNLLKH